jgi:molecular chaperone GrpE
MSDASKRTPHPAPGVDPEAGGGAADPTQGGHGPATSAGKGRTTPSASAPASGPASNDDGAPGPGPGHGAPAGAPGPGPGHGAPAGAPDPGEAADAVSDAAAAAAAYAAAVSAIEAPDAAAAPKPDDLFRLGTDDFSGLESLLSDDFARISSERDEFLDALKRLQADFDNFRKRTERQQAELKSRASEALVLRLLPVLDALELALTHLRLGDTPPPDEASASLLHVNSQLREILAREGLERIDAVGVGFDPTIHEATAMDDSVADTTTDNTDDDGEPLAPIGPTVSEVWRSGYRMGDRVIRPAMVRVRG